MALDKSEKDKVRKAIAALVKAINAEQKAQKTRGKAVRAYNAKHRKGSGYPQSLKRLDDKQERLEDVTRSKRETAIHAVQTLGRY